jgi:hypothetical protein
VFSPGGLHPGHSCGTAGAIAPGQTYTGSITSGTDDWWALAVTSGVQYTVVVTAAGFPPVNTSVYPGTSCASLGTPHVQNGTSTYSFTASATQTIFIQAVCLFGGPRSYSLGITSP